MDWPVQVVPASCPMHAGTSTNPNTPAKDKQVQIMDGWMSYISMWFLSIKETVRRAPGLPEEYETKELLFFIFLCWARNFNLLFSRGEVSKN